MTKDEEIKYGEVVQEFFGECTTYTFATRDSELQKATLDRLQAFLAENSRIKREAIESKDEDFANYCLGLDRVAIALHAEISMWLLLKADDPDEAWRRLITAEIAYGEAIKAHRSFDAMQDQVERLDKIECLVFPPQVYLSMGTVVRSKICSICQQEYGDCDHIAGKPYWGEICHTILRNVEPDHIAIVTEPANKLCRIVHFDVEGGQRNRMTWKIEPKTRSASVDSEGGLVASGILATL
jgi:hypothetical protein